jgi:hypothetical protein
MAVKKKISESEQLYITFTKWSGTSWKTTITNHTQDLEAIDEKIPLFDFWTNKLSKSSVSKKMFPEIISDSYISIHFSCVGLYKYSIMSLRSELESVLRLIYFDKHPVEYNWWIKGKEFDGFFAKKHVWGENFSYFDNIENVKKFYKFSKFSQTGKLFNDIKNLYGDLSQYVHTSAHTFNTKKGKLSPTYDKDSFILWLGKYNAVQSFVHTSLILNYLDEFNASSPNQKKKIIDKGISIKEYRDKIQKFVDD